jgi:hypothetical protein
MKSSGFGELGHQSVEESLSPLAVMPAEAGIQKSP